MWHKIARAHKGIKLSDADSVLTSFGQYSPAYPTTNEDWRFAMRELNPNEKSVLCVTSSGDLPIAFTSSGAHDIDTFDISFFAGVIMDMKTSAIQTMNHEQYCSFVGGLDKTSDISELYGYDKIKTVCPKPSIIAAKQMRGYNIFNRGYNFYPEYMPTESEYSTAKGIISKPINFIWSGLQDLHTQLYKEYDIVYLSNIFEYFQNQKQIVNILNKLKPFVKKNGEIMLYTSWVQTSAAEQIDAAARECGWGEIKSHNQQNAFMLTMRRMR